MKKTFSIIGLLFFSFILFAEKPIVRDIQAEAGKGNKIPSGAKKTGNDSDDARFCGFY